MCLSRSTAILICLSFLLSERASRFTGTSIKDAFIFTREPAGGRSGNRRCNQCGRFRVRFPARSNRTQSRQQHAAAATFLRNCVWPRVKPRRCTVPLVTRFMSYREYIEDFDSILRAITRGATCDVLFYIWIMDYCPVLFFIDLARSC